MNFLTFNIIKKISLHLLVFVFLFLPIFSFAQAPDPATNENDFIICGFTTDDCEFKDLFELAELLIEKLIFMIAIPLATLAIMIGGVMYAMYPANSGYKATAWKIIKAALIGIVVALIAYVLVKAVVGLFVNPAELDLESILP